MIPHVSPTVSPVSLLLFSSIWGIPFCEEEVGIDARWFAFRVLWWEVEVNVDGGAVACA